MDSIAWLPSDCVCVGGGIEGVYVYVGAPDVRTIYVVYVRVHEVMRRLAGMIKLVILSISQR